MTKEFLIKGCASKAEAARQLDDALAAYLKIRAVRKWKWRKEPEFEEKPDEWWAYARIEFEQ